MSKLSKRLAGASVDSLLLAFVKFFTLATGLLCTMILSHNLSLQTYGTYSQGNLVVTLCANATILGLADAANYFFNRSDGKRDLNAYANTVFTTQLIIGVVVASVILICRNWIVGYFNNPLLEPVLLYVAFRPMLTNMTSILQVLIVSIGKAKLVAVRNAAFSALKLLAVFLTALATSDIVILFAILLALDMMTVAWFWLMFRKNRFSVRPVILDLTLVKEILSFSVPMALYVLTTSLTRQIGALIIGANESTDMYAIYANCATVLPLDVVSASFLTVMIPIVTRYIAHAEYDKARNLFKHYLAIGYLTTVTFSVACLVIAPEMVKILYGEKYLPGLTVFCLYLISGMAKFANLSLILSASGKTKMLMAVSSASVIVNAVTCVVGYQLIGLEGPALTTVGVYIVTMVVLLGLSLKELRGRWSDAFEAKALAYYIATLSAAAAVGMLIKHTLFTLGAPWLPSAIAVALFVTGVVLLTNRKSLAASLKAINSMK